MFGFDCYSLLVLERKDLLYFDKEGEYRTQNSRRRLCCRRKQYQTCKLEITCNYLRNHLERKLRNRRVLEAEREQKPLSRTFHCPHCENKEA